MLMTLTGVNAIPGNVTQAGETGAYEIDDCIGSFSASNVESNDGRASCGPMSMTKNGSFKNHEFAKSLFKRNKIGQVKLIRHAMTDGKVIPDQVITLSNACIVAFAPSFSQQTSTAKLTFSYEKIEMETFNEDGTSAGKVEHELRPNKTKP